MKADPCWVEHRNARLTMPRAERRAAIEKGYRDFQMQGLKADTPYPETDPRRWLWQDGWETADLVRQGRANGIEDAPTWR